VTDNLKSNNNNNNNNKAYYLFLIMADYAKRSEVTIQTMVGGVWIGSHCRSLKRQTLVFVSFRALNTPAPFW